MRANNLAQLAPTPQDMGGVYGQPVICRIENVPKANFTSLYDYANRGSNPDMPKYNRTDSAFILKTAVEAT